MAVEHGFRLRVPATALWFNLDAGDWARVRAALEAMGAEMAQGGMDGEELCTVEGLTVSYRAEEQRMQAEVGLETGPGAAACLAALRAAAAAPAAEASPTWLWAPASFRIAGQDAEPAVRVIRAARWRLARARGAEAMAAAAQALEQMDAGATCRLSVERDCAVEVATPLRIADQADLNRRAAMFGMLLRRLGHPLQAEHATHPR